MLSTANGTATSATAVPNVDTTSQASSSRKLRLASAPRSGLTTQKWLTQTMKRCRYRLTAVSVSALTLPSWRRAR